MFVEIFNELLEERNLNRKQFAEQSGIPYTTVIGWTKLNRLPDYTALIKIADFFQCSIDYLVGRQDNYEVDYSFPEVSNSEQTLIKNFRKLDSENKELISNLVKKLLK
ncbi:MAG: helix-turn-helix transcriptional regulator [Clostridiales bacterium]|nr:helix-turn-helix transcriptional regulator [Clostridiales bacterium]